MNNAEAVGKIFSDPPINSGRESRNLLRGALWLGIGVVLYVASAGPVYWAETVLLRNYHDTAYGRLHSMSKMFYLPAELLSKHTKLRVVLVPYYHWWAPPRQMKCG
jgi:hypothetical protein